MASPSLGLASLLRQSLHNRLGRHWHRSSSGAQPGYPGWWSEVQGAQYFHWVVANIPGLDLGAGAEVMEYVPPFQVDALLIKAILYKSLRHLQVIHHIQCSFLSTSSLVRSLSWKPSRYNSPTTKKPTTSGWDQRYGSQAWKHLRTIHFLPSYYHRQVF